jgi:putative hydrolase of the HAD superfamily
VAAGNPALKVLDRIVISSEVGWRKPSPEFFAAVSRAVDVPPRRILFVGDDLANDYEGARAAGMTALLCDPRQRASADIPQIRQLPEVIPLLTR